MMMHKNNPIEEIGYINQSNQVKRPSPEWASVVLSRKKEISPTVSPIMQWWIDKQTKEGLPIHQNQILRGVHKEIDKNLSTG